MAISKVKLKGKNHYQAVLWKNGIRLSTKTFLSRNEAADWLSQQRRMSATYYKAGLKLTLSDFFDTYYYPSLRVSLGTALGYLGIWNLHLKPKLGERRLGDLDSQTIISLFNKIESNGTSPARLNRIRTVLSGLFSYARKVGINVDPLSGVDYYREGISPRKIWTYDEAKRFFKWLKTERSEWFEFYLLAYETGLRFSEIIALKWDCVDLVSGVLEVRQAYCRKAKQLVLTTKSGKPRDAYPSPYLLHIIGLRKSYSRSEYVFSRNDGRMIAYSDIRRSFLKYQRLAGVAVINFHGIRHTFASHFLEKGGELFLLKNLLGHSRFETTLRYSHANERGLREASVKLHGVMSDSNPTT